MNGQGSTNQDKKHPDNRSYTRMRTSELSFFFVFKKRKTKYENREERSTAIVSYEYTKPDEAVSRESRLEIGEQCL